MTIKMVVTGIALSFATGANAECPNASYGTGVVHALTPTNKGDVDLILSMSMMPKMLKVSYDREQAAALPCKLTNFTAGGIIYELKAATNGLSNARIAFPKDKGAAIAELVPVTNILAAIEASKQGKIAPISGYLLLTLTKADTTGWRFYDGVPNQATLVTDMSSALTGNLRPIFKNDASGKSNIYVPGS